MWYNPSLRAEAIAFARRIAGLQLHLRGRSRSSDGQLLQCVCVCIFMASSRDADGHMVVAMHQTTLRSNGSPSTRSQPGPGPTSSPPGSMDWRRWVRVGGKKMEKSVWCSSPSRNKGFGV